MSQLGLGLGLSNVSSLLRFSPLDLDPYLLFDTQSSMIGTFENPTLDLDPANPSTLDVITATRAGVATYTDADGLIQSAAPNTTRVDYTQGAELTPTKFQRVGYTDFSQGWSNYNSTTTVGVGFNDQPSRIVEGTVSNSNNYYFPVTTVDSQLYTYSLYVRRVSGTSSVSLVHTNSPTGTKTSINPTSEWQRFSVVFEGVSGGGTSAIGIEESLAGDSVEIAMPQVEEGTTASDFVANTTGSPKFITGATYGPRVPMILVEPSATNIIYNSSAFSTSGTSVKTTGFEAPDGTNTATKISNMQDATGIRAYSQITGVSGSTAYVGSIYLKGTAGETVRIEGRRQAGATFSSSGTQLLTFDGTWQRVTNLAWTTAADNTAVFILIKNESGTTADEVYLWGSQLEEGSVSTSVIPTSGSPVTRASDNLVISGSDFSDFYNQSEGTFYAESNTRRADGVPFIVEVENGGSNRIYLYHGTTTARAHVKTGGTTQADFSLGNRPAVGVLSRGALSYKTNDIEGSLDGGSVIGDTSATIPTTINRFNLGTRFGQSDTYKLNGHIKRLIYWPYHSDNL